LSGESAERRRLLWQCRRGMKELDLLLVAWLDESWDASTHDERARFAHFLELPDPQLAGYLLRDETPVDDAFEPLARQLRGIRGRKA
jgi:antitoxin CptB